MTFHADEYKAAAGRYRAGMPYRRVGRSGLSLPAIEVAVRVNDNLIRERAYGIWIAEGRPHGREVAHWQRARHELLAAH